MRKAENPRSKSSTSDGERLSAPWVALGTVLFVAALTAPVAVVHMDRDLGVPTEVAENAPATKPVLSRTRQVVEGTGDESLRQKLTDGRIVPGSGVGSVQLGHNIEDVIATIREPSALHFGAELDGLSQSHVFDLDDLRVVIRSDPKIGRIEELGVAALDCKSVRTFQPRQEGLPATEDGLSIGSHVSRVVKRMGPPNAEVPGEPVPAMQGEHLRHSYPGLTLRYCPEDMVVAAISVEGLPRKPADNVPLIAMAEPGAPRMDPLPASEAGVTISADGEIAAVAPTSLANVPDGLRPAASAGVQDLGRDLEVAVADAPAPLLALNGGGFAITDAFATGMADAADADVRHATLGDGATLIAAIPAEGQPGSLLAMASETELNLGVGKRREIQIRLALLGFSPRGADGIFGPRTREAIQGLQTAAKLPATGYLDLAAMGYIKRESERAFTRWKLERARARAAREAEARPVLAARIPSARNAPECARDPSGQIIENQSWSCDVTVLEESLTALFAGNS